MVTRLSVIAAILGAMVVAGCGGAGTTGATTTHAQPTQVAQPATTPSATTTATATTHRPQRRPRPPDARLPQTHQLPSADTATFHAEMRALWAGVRGNSVHAALPAFFPVAAYAQVKAIADPRADWTARLVGGYRSDLAAAHALVGPGARFLRVIVPRAYAHWVDPGTCFNRVGYYEVPNARVVYQANGATRSFGIASMISWRGVWYVVHLGSVNASGVVDDPGAGSGTPAPSSTC
jgi:hypothetical protein